MFKQALILSTTALLLTGTANFAQEVTATVSHELSKKASKAELYGYVIDEEKDLIMMPYLLKDGKKSILLETYKFKLSDLSFISAQEEEVEKETSPYKKKKKNSGYTRLLKVKPNIMNGKINLERGYLSGGYAGRAYITAFNVEDKAQVRTPKGDKFIYLWHKTEETDLTGKAAGSDDGGNSVMMHTSGTFGWGHTSIGKGNVSIVGMEKETPYYSKYGFTTYDAETLNSVMYKSFDIGYSCIPISVKQLPNGNISIIFQPVNKAVIPRTKGAEAKFKLDPENNFHYVELDPEGELIYDIKFKLGSAEQGGLNCINVIPTQNKGELILLGVSKSDEYGTPVQTSPKYLTPFFSDGSNIRLSVKPDQLIAIKIKDGAIVYNKTYPIDAVLSEPKTIGETKAPTDGLKYIFKSGGINVFDAVTRENGNTIITSICGVYHHAITIDPSGKIVVNYISETQQDWVINNEFATNAANDLYWINYDMPAYKKDASTEDQVEAYEKRTGYISKFNDQTNQIDNTISLTPEDVSLDLIDGVKRIDDNKLLILGQGKKRAISLSKVELN